MERFDSIYIMLGFECNFGCVYCLQGDVHKQMIANEPNEAFWGFLDTYPYKDTTRLFFWGGEPLLYWSVIETVVERYSGRYNFGIISNGSLLTEDKVDFLNRHKVHFIFSHDAHITKDTRGRDMWQEASFRKCFERLDSRTINVTVTARSRSYQEIFAYYPEGEDVNLNPLINTCDSEVDRVLAAFKAEDVRRDMTYLLEGFEAGRANEVRNVKKLLTAMLRFMETGGSADRCFDCVYGAKTFNIDTQGNVYVCHNSTRKVGTVADPYEEIAARIHQVVSGVREGCIRCDFKAVCGGSCYLLSGYGRVQQCERLHAVYDVLCGYLEKKGYEADA